MQAERFVSGRRLAGALLMVCAFCSGAMLHAAEPGMATPVVANQALEDEVLELSHKLRCLVCQNQSIAESNAPLAIDLRNQVREQLETGKSKDDVIDYLVERYGDFVLYEPPFKATTMLLWGGPAALLIGGAGWLALRLRRRQAEAAAQENLSTAERDRARALLAGDTPVTADIPSAEEPRS